MIFEAKKFSNLYWDIKKGEPYTKGIYSTEELAFKNIKTDPELIYQDTIPMNVQWEFKGVFTKEKKEEIKEGAVG